MSGASIRMLLSLVIGLAAGALLAVNHAGVLPQLVAIAQPVGKLWLDALTMTVVPLVFGLLVTGIAAAAESASASSVAGRAVLWFAILLVGASLASAISATAVIGVWPLGRQSGLLNAAPGAAPPLASAGDWLSGLIPTNPIKAAADTAMVPLVIFALLFGFALTRIDPRLRAGLVDLFRGLVEAMLVLVRWVLWVAPLGVLALAFVVGARMGTGAVGALLQYVIVVVSSCLAVIVLTYAVAVVAGRLSPLAFARAALPSQAVAVSTQSSLASLPAMIEAAPSLGVSVVSAGVVLPLAVSLFRASSAAANMAVSVYLAHLHGVALSPATLGLGVLTAAALSLAAVGLPAQVSFFATIAPVCLAMGVPIEALPLLLAVETVPDIFRTVGNVTADLAVTRIVGRGRDEGTGA